MSSVAAFTERKWVAVARRDAAIARATPEDVMRFFNRVSKTENCWTMSGFTYGGHVRIWIQGEQVAAHRAAKIWETGLPEGRLLVCHRCNNHSCVRPSHLYWGSYSDNLYDRSRPGGDCYAKIRGEGSYTAKLTNGMVADIWAAYHQNGVRAAALAKQYGVKHAAISALVTGRTWTHVTSCLSKPSGGQGYAMGETATWSKLTEEKVKAIRVAVASGASHASQGRLYGVSKMAIGALINGKTWRHVK